MPSDDPYDGPAALDDSLRAPVPGQVEMDEPDTQPTPEQVAIDCGNGHHSWTDGGRGPCSGCPAVPGPVAKPTKRSRATYAEIDELRAANAQLRELLAEAQTEAAELGRTFAEMHDSYQRGQASLRRQQQAVLMSIRVELARMVVACGVTFEHLGIAALPDAPPTVTTIDTGGLT